MKKIILLFFSFTAVFCHCEEALEENLETKPEKFFRIGPSVNLVGFPTPLRFGVESKIGKYFGAGVEFGFLPSFISTPLVGALIPPNFLNGTLQPQVQLWSPSVGLRFFPFGGSFYVGVLSGFQHLGFTATHTTSTDTGRSLSANATAIWNLYYITPGLGWRFTASNGFFFGLDLGYQIPLSSQVEFRPELRGFTADEYNRITSDPRYIQTVQTTKDSVNTIVATIKDKLPFVSLIRIGWLF